jgi:hypothetical protein
MKSLIPLLTLLTIAFAAHADRIAESGEGAEAAAQPNTEQDQDFNELDMMKVANENCQKAGYSGFTGGAIKVASHPVSFTILMKNMISNRNGNTWTDNYIDYEHTKKLHAAVKQRMDTNPSCYSSTGEALKYTVMGGKIQKYIYAVIGHKPNAGGAWDPLSSELNDLSIKCTKEAGMTTWRDDYTRRGAYYKPRITALTKHPVLLSNSEMADIEEDAMREMIRQTKPATCEDVTKLRGLMVYKFSKIDTYIRLLLKDEGLPVP